MGTERPNYPTTFKYNNEGANKGQARRWTPRGWVSGVGVLIRACLLPRTNLTEQLLRAQRLQELGEELTHDALHLQLRERSRSQAVAARAVPEQTAEQARRRDGREGDGGKEIGVACAGLRLADTGRAQALACEVRSLEETRDGKDDVGWPRQGGRTHFSSLARRSP